MRAYEGICPYCKVSLLIDEGASLKQGNALFNTRKRPLQSERGVSFFAVSCLLLTALCFITHSEVTFTVTSERNLRMNRVGYHP